MLKGSVRPAVLELFAICAMSAMADALTDGGRYSAAVHAVCGLSVALCVARIAMGLLG